MGEWLKRALLLCVVAVILWNVSGCRSQSDEWGEDSKKQLENEKVTPKGE